MSEVARLEVVSETPPNNSWGATIVFQGEAVPRDKDEAKDPELIRIRMARDAYDRLLDADAMLEQYDTIPGIDENLRRSMGFPAVLATFDRSTVTSV